MYKSLTEIHYCHHEYRVWPFVLGGGGVHVAHSPLSSTPALLAITQIMGVAHNATLAANKHAKAATVDLALKGVVKCSEMDLDPIFLDLLRPHSGGPDGPRAARKK